MANKTHRSLSLQKETLRVLQVPRLITVRGGATPPLATRDCLDTAVNCYHAELFSAPDIISILWECWDYVVSGAEGHPGDPP